MTAPALTALLQNAAALLAIVVVFDLLTSRQRVEGKPWRQILAGLVIGGLGIALIMAAYPLEPGVVFDTRSVLLAVSGLFLGTIPTAVAMAMTGAYRLWQGGAAGVAGTVVILVTGGLGIVWRHYRGRSLAHLSWGELYGFGVVVHLAMLAVLTVMLPGAAALRVLQGIGLPVLLIYPVATAALGLLLANRLRRENVAAELAASEARFRTLIKLSPIAIGIVNRAGVVVYFNDRCQKLFGYTATEIPTIKEWWPLIYPDETYRRSVQATWDARLAQAVQAGTDVTPLETNMTCKDGRVRVVEVSGLMIGEDLFTTFTDLTARKQAEAARRESDEQFRAVFNLSPVGMCLTGPEGRLREANPALGRLLGYAPEELAQRTFTDITHPEDVAASRECVRRLLAGEGDTFSLEKRYLTQPGGTVWAWVETALVRDDRGQPLHFLTHILDLTARRQAEAALRESEERFRRLVESAPDAIFIQTEGRFAYVNAAAARLFGASDPEALVGQPVAPRFEPDYHPELEQRLRALAPAHPAEQPVQEVCLQLAGRPITLHISAVGFAYQGRPGALVFARDITERKQAEGRIQSQLAELQRWQDVMLNREERVQELKREVNELCRGVREPVRYPSQAAPAAAPAPPPST